VLDALRLGPRGLDFSRRDFGGALEHQIQRGIERQSGNGLHRECSFMLSSY
jgi:hypothetical protein